MSNNLIKRTAVASAVSTVLIAGTVNASNLNTKTFINQSEHEVIVKSDVVNKNQPTSFLVVLKATTAADMMEQGVYNVSSAQTSFDNIANLQGQVKDRLFALDSNVKVLGSTKVLAPTLIVQATPGALEKIKLNPRVIVFYQCLIMICMWLILRNILKLHHLSVMEL